MAAIPLPTLDDEKAAKIAQSDKWGALSRLSSIFAAGVTTILLAPLVIWSFATTQQSAVLLAQHSTSIATAQTTLDQIKSEVGTDHDVITILKVQMDGVIVQVQKLWERPAAPTGKH